MCKTLFGKFKILKYCFLKMYSKNTPQPIIFINIFNPNLAIEVCFV